MPVFEWVELNAIVEEMLERFSRVLGALVEQRAQLANTRDDVLGSRCIKWLERSSELLKVALLFVRERFELADLLKDGGRGRAAGGEIDEVVDPSSGLCE